MTNLADVEQAWNPHRGNTYLRCRACSKAAYASRERAEEAAEKVAQAQPMEVYFSSKCGWWHLTRRS